MQRRDVAAVIGLAFLLAACVAGSWLRWGDLDVDYGREMFVPWRLAEGDVLYRDVRYPYGPFSPYLHALGYRLWKPHLGVLYASGIATTAAIALVLYAIARALASPGVAFLATALVALDLMFFPGAPGTFSYVFPYAYPALHGLLFVLAALCASLRLLAGGGHATAAAAGSAIGFAVLAKPEFAVAAMGIGVLAAGLVVATRDRPGPLVATLAACALGVAVAGYGCLAVWVPAATIWSRGLFAPEYFRFGEYILPLIAGFRPNSGWRERAATLAELWDVGVRSYAKLLLVVAIPGVAFGALRAIARRSPLAGPVVARVTGISAAVAAAVWLWPETPAGIPRFPPLMPAAVAAAFPRYGILPPLLLALVLWDGVALVREWRREGRVVSRRAQRFLIAATGLALLARVPAALVPRQYANFYLPVGILVLVVLLVDALPRGLGRFGGAADASRAAAGTVVALLLVSLAIMKHREWSERDAPLHTARGTLVLERDDVAAVAYREALAWLDREAPPGATLLAIPRGAALEFLSGHGNRLYEVSLVGVVPDVAAERAYTIALERLPPALIITSDQRQLEYGRGRWGINDNVHIARWVASRYDRAAVLGGPDMRLTVWRRRGLASPGPEATAP